MSTPTMHVPAAQASARRLLVAPAFCVALLAMAGSLWLGIGMQRKACPLCFYQRSFVMGVVAILGTGLLGTGLLGNGLLGKGLVGKGLVGKGLVGKGLVGKGLVGKGLVGKGRHHDVLSLLPLLALPLAVAGIVTAAFHVLLEAEGELECPAGLLRIASAPQQSAAILGLLLLLLGIGAVRAHHAEKARLLGAGVGLGVLLAFGAIVSAPPMPDAPGAPYASPPDVCRAPYESP